MTSMIAGFFVMQKRDNAIKVFLIYFFNFCILPAKRFSAYCLTPTFFYIYMYYISGIDNTISILKTIYLYFLFLDNKKLVPTFSTTFKIYQPI